MNLNTLYSGDLAALTSGAIAANDSTTREQDSLRNYLARLAQVGSEDRRTGAYERTQNKDADVRMALGRGAIDNTRLGITTGERLAMLRNAIDEKLGQGQIDAYRYGIDNSAKAQGNQFELGKMQIDAQKALQQLLGEQQLKQIQATNLWGNPLTGRMGESAIGAMTDASAANAEAAAAAGRANSMIPAAADELGHWYTPGDSVPHFLKAMASPNPDAEQALLKSKLTSQVLKNLGVDAAKVQLGPGGTNFIPVTRIGVPASLATPKISQINAEMAAQLETWRNWKDPVQRAAGVSRLLNQYKQTTGTDYPLPSDF